MKIKEGMFVRTKHGIRKIIKIDEDNNCYIDKTYINNFRQEINCISDSCIIGEPSFDILDLIEVGDYVNGEYIIQVSKTFGLLFIEATYYDEVSGEEKHRFIKKEEIKSIVTKEQFEQMSYKVGE